MHRPQLPEPVFSDFIVSIGSGRLVPSPATNPTPPGVVLALRSLSSDVRVLKMRHGPLKLLADELAQALAHYPEIDLFDAIVGALDEAGAGDLPEPLASHPIALYERQKPMVPPSAGVYRPGEDIDGIGIVANRDLFQFDFQLVDGTFGRITMATSVAFMLLEHLETHLVDWPR